MKKAAYLALSAVLILGMAIAVNGCAGSKESMETADTAPAGDGPAPVDMTGLWIMSVDTPNGSGTPSFDLTQEGDQLSGTYTGRFGEFPVTGNVNGNQFEIRYDSSGALIKYIGECDGNAVKGKVDFGTYGSGTFTGEKQ